MSYTERNKGRLYPVSRSQYPKAVLDDLDEYDDLMELNGQLYRVEYDVCRSDESYFAEIREDYGGVIHFHTMHYNGGGHITEVLESALKNDKISKG